MDQLVATISSFASGGESTTNNNPATTEVKGEGVGYEIIIDNVGHVCKVQEEHDRQQQQAHSSILDYDSLMSTVKNLHTSLLDVLTLSTCDTAGCTQLTTDDERSCGAGGPSWSDFEIPCVVRVTRKKKKIDMEEWIRLRRAAQKRGRGDDDNHEPKGGRTAFTSELDLYLFNQESIQWCESSEVDDNVPRMIDVKSSCRRRSDFGARSLSQEFVVLQ